MRYKSLAYAAAAVITLVGCVDHTETPAAVSLNDTSQETGLSDASSPDNDQGSRGASDTEPPKWPAGAILSFTPEGLQRRACMALS